MVAVGSFQSVLQYLKNVKLNPSQSTIDDPSIIGEICKVLESSLEKCSAPPSGPAAVGAFVVAAAVGAAGGRAPGAPAGQRRPRADTAGAV